MEGLVAARLADPVADVRLAAAETLGWIGTRASVAALLVVLHDREHAVRAAAHRTLARVCRPPWIAGIDPADEECREVLEALPAEEDIRHAMTAAVGALHDRSPLVRRAALGSLEGFGHPQLARFAQQAMGDIDRDVRKDAVGTLATCYRCEWPQADAPVEHSAAVGALLRSDRAPEVRRAAIEAVCWIGANVQEWLNLASEDPDGSVRAAAMEARHRRM